MKTLALDVGGTAIKSALFLNGEQVQTNECPSDGILGGPHVMKRIQNVIDSYHDYDVIGISTTGQVHPNTGTILYANENVPNYTGTNVKDILETIYQKPVYVENDVNAAALGEAYYGAGKHLDDFLCVTYGTGIGGAIVINKHIYTGSNFVAGELGHMITHPNGLVCNCGNRGCYEQYASTTALVRNASRLDPNFKNGRVLFDAMRNNNTIAKQQIDLWIDEIIYGLVNLIHLFNPPCIVLGGGIMNQPYVTDEINSRIQTRIMKSFQPVKLIPAMLENNAGVYGMLAIATKSKQ